jgi:hypothetical protein
LLQDRLRGEPETPLLLVSSKEAAAEKAAAGESLAVEHIAELAPGQARRARAASKRGVNKELSDETRIKRSRRERPCRASTDKQLSVLRKAERKLISTDVTAQHHDKTSITLMQTRSRQTPKRTLKGRTKSIVTP